MIAAMFGTIVIAPQGHSFTHSLQLVQRWVSIS